MFAPLLRGFVFLTFMFWYSIGIWRYIEEYFSDKFAEMLRLENETLVIKNQTKSESCRVDIKIDSCSFVIEDIYKQVCFLMDYLKEIFFIEDHQYSCDYM